jgi:predicted nucleic acid-binding protein
MKVLVDTTVWSLALRRTKNATLSVEHQSTVNALIDLINDGRAVMIGPIRQELLSGIKTKAAFDVLQSKLSAFEDVKLALEDFEKAAEIFNICRANGVQGSSTDFLICAVALNHQLPIFSVDLDFLNYQKYISIPIHVIK